MSRKSIFTFVVAMLAAGLAWKYVPGILHHGPAVSHDSAHGEGVAHTGEHPGAHEEPEIEYPKDHWPAAGIEVAPVTRNPLLVSQSLTGKVGLNEDRLAHVFPLVEGRAEEVKIQFGQQVKKGEILVVVQSKEVGKSMLELYQNRLKLTFTENRNAWTQEVSKNTLALIEAMRKNVTTEIIEEEFQHRVLGDYREKLMTPYVSYLRSEKTSRRLAPLSQEGAISGRQLVEADSDLDASRAMLKSILEQVYQDAQQAVILSEQTLSESRTTVAVAEANLKILGFTDADLQNINPADQGESLAHYYITAPFDGTVIAKDVTPMERVSPENQILTIADLSQVWITADIFQSQLSLLSNLSNTSVIVRSDAYPGTEIQAKIFYTGDIIDESSRTLSLRAEADNSLSALKPGMFVSIEIPGAHSSPVIQVPVSALVNHNNQDFVFVQTGDRGFQAKNVKLGRRTPHSAEILTGLNEGESIAVQGAFALKSKMLSALLEE